VLYISAIHRRHRLDLTITISVNADCFPPTMPSIVNASPYVMVDPLIHRNRGGCNSARMAPNTTQTGKVEVMNEEV
jgi:hypothetical protein